MNSTQDILKKEYVAYRHSHKMHVYHGIRVGAIAERMREEHAGRYTKVVKQVLGKHYRHLHPLRKLYAAAAQGIEGLEEFVQDQPIVDPEKFTPFITRIEAWADGRSMNKLMSDLAIIPSRDQYTSVNKTRIQTLNELADIVGEHLDSCPFEVQQAYSKLGIKQEKVI